MKLYIESSGKVFDLTDAATGITWESTYRSGAARLEVTVLGGGFSPGDMLTFEQDGEKAFSGRVFSIRREGAGTVRLTAYDQLRYLKAQDVIFRKGMTLEDLLAQGCTALGLRLGQCASTGFPLPDKTFDNKAWLDVLYDSIQELKRLTGAEYCLYDDFGAIRLALLQDLRQPIILGEGSLITGYSQEESLENAANRIKLVQPGNGALLYEDNASMKNWGVLQHLEKLDGGENQAQADQLGKSLLQEKNRVGKTLSLSCLGDLRVRGGRGVRVVLPDLSLDGWMVVDRVRHTIRHGDHTMEVELVGGAQ